MNRLALKNARILAFSDQMFTQHFGLVDEQSSVQ